MREEILNSLSERVGAAVGIGYYAKIDEWLAWWRGTNRSFHYYWENGVGGYPIRRELYRLNMAKKICEDWASILMNDRTYLRAEDELTMRWLNRCMDDVFFRNVNRLVEKAFATGTGACLVRLDGAVLDEKGRLLPVCGGNQTKINFDFVDASHIIPISVRGGEIVEAAFVSEVRERGEELIYLEIHTLEEDGYCIRNELFRLDGGSLERVKEHGRVASFIRTGSNIPFFANISDKDLQVIQKPSCVFTKSVIHTHSSDCNCKKNCGTAFILIKTSNCKTVKNTNIYLKKDKKRIKYTYYNRASVTNVLQIREKNKKNLKFLALSH